MWWRLFTYRNNIYKFDVCDCLQNKTTNWNKKKNICFDCPKGQFSLRGVEHSRRKGQILALPPEADFLLFSLPGHALLPSHSRSIPRPVWHPAKDLEVNLFFDRCNAIEVWRFYGITVLCRRKRRNGQCQAESRSFAFDGKVMKCKDAWCLGTDWPVKHYYGQVRYCNWSLFQQPTVEDIIL